MRNNKTCHLCGTEQMVLQFQYTKRPKGEKVIKNSSYCDYHREVWECKLCGLLQNYHDLFSPDIYAKEYVDATYGNEGIYKDFKRIITIQPEKSDNYGRVMRILQYMSRTYNMTHIDYSQLNLLDIGTGLGVFPFEMKKYGWNCTCIDPDPRSCKHAEEVVNVKSICSDFRKHKDPIGTFDLISINKVLEHVENPIDMLAKCKDYMHEKSVLYLEVPDGEIAQLYGADRGEFDITHFFTFSMVSLGLLISKAGFAAKIISRIKEPSGKFTLYAFVINA